jgi:hypothetical protein
MIQSLDKQLTEATNNSRLRRAFAARLDMTMKRAKLTSAHLARSLRIPERDISLWRAGIVMPGRIDCQRVSSILDIDVKWLCSG